MNNDDIRKLVQARCRGCQRIAEYKRLGEGERMKPTWSADGLELPRGIFTTVVADPPWDYRDGLGRGAKYTKRGAETHYDLLPVSAIKALPVDDMAALDSHLYLWATNAFIVEGHDIAEAWGFEVKTILTWEKPGIGMGHWFRNNSEHILFATRGRLGLARHDLPTVYHWPRRGHSEKPEEFFQMVESASPGDYLELFGRRLRPGWTVWGNEVGKRPNQLLLPAGS